jgi:putative transposase
VAGNTGVLKNMWRVKKKNNKIQLSLKYKIYPMREVEEKLLRVMQIEAKVYNALLDVVNNARKEGRMITPKDTQSMLKDLKIEGKELVYSSNGEQSTMVQHQLSSRTEEERKESGETEV